MGLAHPTRRQANHDVPEAGRLAETSAALIIQGASIYGIPLSTTHVISTSIMGVGAMKRFSGVRWGVVERERGASRSVGQRLALL